MLKTVVGFELLRRMKSKQATRINIVVVSVNISMCMVLNVMLHLPRVGVSTQHVDHRTNLAINPLAFRDVVVNSVVHYVHPDPCHT